MDTYELERTIWQRVLSGAPVQNGETGHAKTVLQLLKETAAARRCYAALACRVNGGCQKTLQRLAQEAHCQEKVLQSVYYLLTGSCARLACQQVCRGAVCPLLRERHTAEQRASAQFAEAAERYDAFKDLYAALSRQALCRAEALRRMLQALL